MLLSDWLFGLLTLLSLLSQRRAEPADPEGLCGPARVLGPEPGAGAEVRVSTRSSGSRNLLRLWFSPSRLGLADSFCGAFVSREKLRRSTG